MDAGAPTSRRILVVRACRPAQFADAVRFVRHRHPDAEVVGLSHRGHRDSMRAAGVDRICEIRGRRFGLLRLSPAALRRLRRERFDEVVIPQMSADPCAHGNVYRVAASVGPRSVTVIAPGTAPRTLDPAVFRREILKNLPYEIARRFESPLALFIVLIAARFIPRGRRRDEGRTRILHIIGSLGVGGAQRQLAEVVNSTPADHYDVEVLVMERAGGEFSRQWLARDDVPVAYLTQWPRLVSSAFEIARHCRRGRYDIVHSWLFMSNVVGAAGARLAGVPAIVASVRSLSLWKRTWYRQWWFRAADILGSWAADVVTVNAEALAVDHGRWALVPRRRMAVVHNGLDPAQFALDRFASRAHLLRVAGLPDDARVVGTVGRLAVEKDHLTFLEVVETLRAARPDVYGVIVGDGQMRAELEQAAADSGLSGAVRFLGEREDAWPLTAGFDAFLLPSTIEGFPNALLEAVFLGVPSVATRVGGSPDVLPNAEDTFTPGDVAAAAARLGAMLDAPEQARARAEEMRRRALQLFTTARSVRRWLDLYEDFRPRRARETRTRRSALLSRL